MSYFVAVPDIAIDLISQKMLANLIEYFERKNTFAPFTFTDFICIFFSWMVTFNKVLRFIFACAFKRVKPDNYVQ